MTTTTDAFCFTPAPRRRVARRSPAAALALVAAIMVAVTAAAQPICPGSVSSACECESLFAYRVLELARAGGGTPVDCNDALGVDVAPFSYTPPGGIAGVPSPMCRAIQTANECRDDWYASPPAVADLWFAGSSHRAQWVPRCADGTNSCATDEAVCQDGTRPMIYVDQAVDMAGADTNSNRWIFYLGGEGGPCSERSATRGAVVTGQCWDNYRFGGRKSKDEFKTAMSSMHPDFRPVKQTVEVRGLLDDAATFPGGVPNNFRHFNRVKINRCSDWASDAEQMSTVVPLAPAAWGAQPVTDQVNVWHRGHDITSAIFNFLTTPAGRDIDDDGEVDLPNLNQATTVLLAASSDSTNWLTTIADQLRDELRTVSPEVEVKILVDGLFDPMLENEARYNANAWPGSLFGAPFDNPLGELLPVGVDPAAGRDYSNQKFDVGGSLRLSWDDRNTFMDESCEVVHGVGAMQCYDNLHVLLNHVDTSFFIYAEQNDGTVSDNLGWADDRDYQPTHETYRTRVRDQAEDVELAWGARIEEAALATPADPVRGYMIPWGTRHVHLGDNAQMAKPMTECTDDGAGGWLEDTQPFAEMLHRWLIFDTEYFAVEDERGAVVMPSPHWVSGDGTTVLCGHPHLDDGTLFP